MITCKSNRKRFARRGTKSTETRREGSHSCTSLLTGFDGRRNSFKGVVFSTTLKTLQGIAFSRDEYNLKDVCIRIDTTLPGLEADS